MRTGVWGRTPQEEGHCWQVQLGEGLWSAGAHSWYPSVLCHRTW